jgi:cell wall-associated NlpC family hydrolase
LDRHAADWDAFAERHLRAVLTAFQRVEVQVRTADGGAPVPVRVHAPYMLQTVSILQDQDAFTRLEPRHRARLLRVKVARDEAGPETRAYLQGQFYDRAGRERDVAKGRANPGEVKALLQGAVDRGLVPARGGRPYPDGRDLRAWLRRFGVGVDCSGFVQHALNSLVAASHAALGQGIGPADHTGFLRAGWVYREASTACTGDESRFGPVGTPAEARPGDVLVRPGHVRIVVGLAKGGKESLVLDLAESTSARGVPCGLERAEADVGPRLIQMIYPAPEQPVGGQAPLLRLPREKAFEQAGGEREYVLGRFHALGRLWAARASR